jgi:hypothetical protein
MSNKKRGRDSKGSFWTTIPGCLTAIAALLTAIGGLMTILFTVGIFKSPTPVPTTEIVQCLISGLIFDSDSNQPLSGVWVSVFRDLSDIQQRPQELKADIATTGPDGKFSFDCNWVDESQFPLLLAVRHADWVETQITGPRIERAGDWEGINIPIQVSEIEMQPLRELLVSFSSKKVGSNWFVVGDVENKSERSFPCIKLRFSISTSYQDRLQGTPSLDLGLLDVELRDLRPHEKRPYEKQLPQQVGFGLYSKEECQ